MDGIDDRENRLVEGQCGPNSLFNVFITSTGISSLPIKLRHTTYTSELPDLLVPGLIT